MLSAGATLLAGRAAMIDVYAQFSGAAHSCGTTMKQVCILRHFLAKMEASEEL